MKLIWVVIGVIIVIMVVGGYFSTISGFTELGPIMSEFSSALGKVVGGVVLIVSAIALAGVLIHYHILRYKKKKRENQEEKQK
ncbi:hypothetical protein [[Eubacterium] cellulosolvens]